MAHLPVAALWKEISTIPISPKLEQLKKFVMEEKNSACINSTCSIRLLELLVYVEGGARCSQLIKWAWLDVISQ